MVKTRASVIGLPSHAGGQERTVKAPGGGTITKHGEGVAGKERILVWESRAYYPAERQVPRDVYSTVIAGTGKVEIQFATCQ